VSYQCDSEHNESDPVRDCLWCCMQLESAMRCFGTNLYNAGMAAACEQRGWREGWDQGYSEGLGHGYSNGLADGG